MSEDAFFSSVRRCNHFLIFHHRITESWHLCRVIKKNVVWGRVIFTLNLNLKLKVLKGAALN